MEAEEARLFGPAIASAHFKDQSHYHYFYSCSYAYQQGGTYGMSWYMCPADRWTDRLLGDAMATALGVWGPTPLLRWLGGMLVVGNEWAFTSNDGSLRGSTSDWRQACGWHKWYWTDKGDQWLYYYCSGNSYYKYAWDDKYHRLWYVKYP